MCDAHPKFATATTIHMRHGKRTLKDPGVQNEGNLIRAPLHPVVEVRAGYGPHKNRGYPITCPRGSTT
eukprot:4375448-Pyramimonas_sp.AAC.1